MRRQVENAISRVAFLSPDRSLERLRVCLPRREHFALLRFHML